jgi:hypothetical protein
MKPEPARAACAGMSWLFESTNVIDHRAARQICQTCPILSACHEKLAREFTMHPPGSPMGTWAGMLIGKRGRRQEVAV